MCDFVLFFKHRHIQSMCIVFYIAYPIESYILVHTDCLYLCLNWTLPIPAIYVAPRTRYPAQQCPLKPQVNRPDYVCMDTGDTLTTLILNRFKRLYSLLNHVVVLLPKNFAHVAVSNTSCECCAWWLWSWACK